MTQGFLEIFSIEFYSEKWNQGGGIGFQMEINEKKYKNINS